MLATPKQHDVCEDEVCEDANCEVAPLIGGSNKSAAEPGHDPDLLEGDGEEDSGPADATDEQVGSDDERPGEEPVDVAHVKD